MIPHTNADEAIARELLRVDRGLWQTLSCLKKICTEMYLKNLFSNKEFANYLLETVLAIEQAQGRLRDDHRPDESTEDRQLFRWLGSGPTN